MRTPTLTNTSRPQTARPFPAGKKPRSSYFLIMAWIAVFAAVAGFATTFILPMARGSFKAPFVVHLHGMFAFGWIGFFLLQTILVRKKNLRLHRKLGWAGLALALGAAITASIKKAHTNRISSPCDCDVQRSRPNAVQLFFSTGGPDANLKSALRPLGAADRAARRRRRYRNSRPYPP